MRPAPAWGVLCSVLIFFAQLAAYSRPAAPPKSPAPFRLGIFVGADPVGWGDLPGKDTRSGIEGICADAAERGLNAVWVSGFDGNSAKEDLIGVWLGAAQKKGLKVVLQGSAPPYAIPKGDPKLAEIAREEVAPTWRRLAKRWGGHPALLAYSPVEEIGDNVEAGDTPTLDGLAAVGRAVAQVDKAHPVVTTHIAAWEAVAAAEARLRRENLGALVVDLYVFSRWHDWIDPNSKTAWKTAEEGAQAYLDFNRRYAEMASLSGVPFWIIAQGFSSIWTRKIEGRVESRPNTRAPTAAETRFQVWASILAGAKAVFFFTYQSFQEPSAESKATLEEWETNVGLRTLQGEETEALKELGSVGGQLKPSYALLGRLEPVGDAVSEEGILVRRFKDPTNGRLYAVFLNRNLTETRPIPSQTLAHAGLPSARPLKPGDGRLVALP